MLTRFLKRLAALVSAQPETPKADSNSSTAPAEKAEPESSANKKPHGKSYYLKRRRATLWLVAIFAVALAGASLLYPRRGAVYRPTPVIITVTIPNSETIRNIFIDVSQSPSSANLFDMNFGFRLIVEKNIRAPSPPSEVKMFIWLPNRVVPEFCKHGVSDNEKCYYRSPEVNRNTSKGSVDLVTSQAKGKGPSGNQSYTSLNLLLNSRVLMWEANGLNIEAEFPVLNIQTSQESSKSLHIRLRQFTGDPQVRVSYRFPSDLKYDWTGGPPPTLVTTSFGGVEWVEPLKSLAAPTAVSGTDSYEASSDSLRTFMAGALLGISGGALVGAIQELTHRREDARVLLAQDNDGTRAS